MDLDVTSGRISIMPINEIRAWVTYNGWALIKASVTSNHGPRTIFITRTIFASKADWSARKIFFCRCCSHGHIRLRAPYGLTRLYTYGLVEWFAGLHGCPVRCPYGHCYGPTRESSIYPYSTGPVRCPCGTRKGAVRHPCGNVRIWYNQKWQKFVIPLVFFFLRQRYCLGCGTG